MVRPLVCSKWFHFQHMLRLSLINMLTQFSLSCSLTHATMPLLHTHSETPLCEARTWHQLPPSLSDLRIPVSVSTTHLEWMPPAKLEGLKEATSFTESSLTECRACRAGGAALISSKPSGTRAVSLLSSPRRQPSDARLEKVKFLKYGDHEHTFSLLHPLYFY